jgi:hypothetical protein
MGDMVLLPTHQFEAEPAFFLAAYIYIYSQNEKIKIKSAKFN